jgi:hypothetical protein
MDRRGIGDEPDTQARRVPREIPDVGANPLLGLGGEAIEGGGMEEVEAVSNVRAATAEFLYGDGRWKTDGRVYFNLAPTATVKYLSSDLELVAEEHAAARI